MVEDREEFKAFLRSRRAEHMQLAVDAGQLNPDFDAKVLAPADLEQALDGFQSVLFEALDGANSDQTDFFLSVVVPALIASGHPIEGQIHGFVAWTTLMTADIVAHYASSNPAALHHWWAGFLGQHCRRMLDAARDAAPATAE